MHSNQTSTITGFNNMFYRIWGKNKKVRILTKRFALMGLVILLGGIFNDYRGGHFKLPIGKWVNVIVDWLIDNTSFLFESIKDFISILLNNIEKFLLWLPWWAVLLLIAMIALWVAGRRVAIFSVACMYFILILGLWDLSMATVALMSVAVLISNVIGIPLGIMAARSDRFESLIRPLLDAMQTMPAFVYLIPALMFFGIGRVPGVVASQLWFRGTR